MKTNVKRIKMVMMWRLSLLQIEKNDKMQHKFTYFGVQIRTLNTVTRFLLYDLFYSINSVQSFEWTQRRRDAKSEFSCSIPGQMKHYH